MTSFQNFLFASLRLLRSDIVVSCQAAKPERVNARNDLACCEVGASQGDLPVVKKTYRSNRTLFRLCGVQDADISFLKKSNLV